MARSTQVPFRFAPIIARAEASDGRIMDGMHRVCKALLLGHRDIEAVRFVEDPTPDYIGVAPDDLPYPE